MFTQQSEPINDASQSNSRLRSLQSSPPSSLSSWTESSTSSKKVSISQMVLEEMRGRNPEPVRPASGAKYELDLAQRVDELIREAAAARRKRQGFEHDIFTGWIITFRTWVGLTQF